VRPVRVLVTGSRGFVGGFLVAHLRQVGDEVLELPAEVDITDGERLEAAVAEAGADAICHLAAQASVAASWRSPAATWAVNAGGVVNLLDAAGRTSPRPRVLLVSSAEVYGRVAPSELPLGEDRAFAPVSPYAASKAAAELAGLQAWLGRGLEVVRARPFNHTGPGQPADFVVPSLARQVVEAGQRGLTELAVGNVEARRDITDVRDVVRAYRLLLADGVPGEAYNVCSGCSQPISELIERLAHLGGVELALRVEPGRLRPVDVPDLRGDPGRLVAATGWQRELTLDRTLADVLAWWQESLAGDAGSGEPDR